MYTQDFYITEPVGNNAFLYHERQNKKLFVPALKKIEHFDEIELLSSTQHLSPTLSCQEREQMQEKITFEDYDFDGKIQTCFGLKNLYELSFFGLQHSSQFFSQGEKMKQQKHIQRNIPVYLVDNHNHVFYFWYLARKQEIISDGAILYHVDEHADMRDPGIYLLKPDSQDLQKVFEYTNYFLNVGNFIVPAMKEGLVGKVVQIRSEGALKEYNNPPIQLSPKGRNRELQSREERGNLVKEPSIILNLDLDFFQPELDYIDFQLKKQVILDIAAKADLITICTSPFFIEQERALNVLKEIFDK